MSRILLIKYGELTLKGLNRGYFMNCLTKNISSVLRAFPGAVLTPEQGRLVVSGLTDDMASKAAGQLVKVFGIVRIAVASEVAPSMEAITSAAVGCMAEAGSCTFKVETTRSDKSFPLTSPQVSSAVGEALCAAYPDALRVNVTSPDLIVRVEIRRSAYVYSGEIPAHAGLPVPTGGSGAVLLSGGIDSPVASWLMSRRGMKVTGVHFHSYPYTSLQALQKVEDIAGVLGPWNLGFELLEVNIAALQEEIIKRTKNQYLTVLLRRQMIKIACLGASRFGYGALITGESLGQVASQTLESIACTDDASTLPVLRPLIGNDKNEIVALARKIGTYDISIRPFEDCCTIFVPKHPITRPGLEAVLEQEALLDESLAVQALESAQLKKF